MMSRSPKVFTRAMVVKWKKEKTPNVKFTKNNLSLFGMYTKDTHYTESEENCKFTSPKYGEIKAGGDERQGKTKNISCPVSIFSRL